MIRKLSDISEFIIDTKHNTPEYADEGYPCIRTPNIGCGYFDLDNVRYVSETTYEKWTERAAPKEGDLILAREAPVGNVAWIPPGLKVCIGQRTVLIRPLKEIVDSRYLNYYLLSDECQNRMHSLSGGATVAHLNMSDIRAFEVHELPTMIVQKQIAAILSAYDDLIENNLRRIKILEEMAQNLYREWFVNFRFPGHEQTRFVDSPLGRIPEGWEVIKVEQIVKRVPSGKKYNQKTVNEIGSVPVLDQGRSGIIGYHDDEPGVLASEKSPIIVYANHTCYQRLVMFSFSAIQNVLPFLPNPQYQRDIYWLHYATKDLVAFNDYKGHWPEFVAKQIIIPLSFICEQFGGIVEPLTRLVFMLEKNNSTLSQTRDLLLPKLISGEVDVSDLDINVPEEVSA